MECQGIQLHFLARPASLITFSACTHQSASEASVKFLLLLLLIIPLCRIFFTSLPCFVLTPSLWTRSGRYYDPLWPLRQPQTFMWCLQVPQSEMGGKYWDQRGCYPKAQILPSPLAINLKITLAHIYWAPFLLVLGMHWWTRLTQQTRGRLASFTSQPSLWGWVDPRALLHQILSRKFSLAWLHREWFAIPVAVFFLTEFHERYMD